MSLRRSARVQSQTTVDPPTLETLKPGNAPPLLTRNKINKAKTVANGKAKLDANIKTKKRKQTDNENDHGLLNGAPSTTMEINPMPPPLTTPIKRRKPPAPPSLTPTPTATKLIAAPIAQPLLHPNETPPRRASAHHTNATLVTPGGTKHIAPPPLSDSPSKPARSSTSTTTTASSKDILDRACAHLISNDPRFTTLITAHPCKVFSPAGLAEEVDPFAALSTGILSQQVSGAAAASIKRKFIALFPEPCTFPTPAQVVATPLPRLREAGLSQRKAEYIQGLAEKFVSGELTIPMLMTGSDEEVMENLIKVRGLGEWSVQMFMCFGLKRLDIFATGDLGVQRGMAAWKGRDVAKLKAKGGGKWKYMTEKEMLEISEPYRPYRSLFMWYMWRVEDVNVDAMQDNAVTPADSAVTTTTPTK